MQSLRTDFRVVRTLISLVCVGIWGVGVSAVQLMGATNTFRWVSSAGGALDEVGRAVARDPNGESVVAGNFFGTMIAGSTTLTNAGDSDVFVARVTTNGVVTRAWRAGGKGEDSAFAVGVDTNRDVIVAGVFRSSISFGPVNLSGAGSTLEIFLAKYNSEGGLLWAQRAGGEGDDRAESLVVDGEGNIFVSGSFQGAATFGTGTSIVSNFIDTFLAKYRPDGTLVWVKKFSATSGALGRSVAVGVDGRLALTGRFLGTLVAGTNTLSSAGDSDVFVLRLSPEGETVWARKAGGGVGDSGLAVAFDRGGALFVGGYFSGTAAFDAFAVGAAGGRDAFLARYREDGSVDWVRKGGGTLDDAINSVAVDAQGNCYVAGQFINAARFEPVTVGDTTRGTEALLARYGPSGSMDWIASAGSETSADVANAVVAGGRGDVFVTGSFRSSATFGTNVVTSVGGSDLYVAARVKEVPIILVSPTNTVVLGASNAVFSVTAGGGGPLTYQWEKGGEAIPNETNSVLVLSAVKLSDAGVYRVQVGNPDGVVYSEEASLQVEFLLNLVTIGQGQVFVDPLLVSYPGGSTVEMLAIPAADSFFSRWQGGVESVSNPVSLVLTGHTTVTVVFGNTSLDVGVGVGSGKVTRTPARDRYERGDTVILTAVASRYFEFLSWDDGVKSNPRVITIGAVNRYRAHFTNTVELETIQFGGVSRTAPVGLPAVYVDNVFELEGPVLRGESAEIRLATSFVGGAILYSLDGSEPTEVYEKPFRVTSPVRLRAVALSSDFQVRRELDAMEIQVLRTYSLVTGVRGGGTLTVEPRKTLYLKDDLVRLTATPAAGWELMGWNGNAATSAVAEITLAMDQNRCMEPVFGTRVTASAVGAGEVKVEPDLELHPFGSQVRFVALPEVGTNFGLWGGSASGSQNPLSIQITNSKPTVSAIFLSLATNQFSLVVRPVGLGSVSVLPRQNRYTNGQTVALVPKPDAGQTFLGWRGGASGNTNPLVLTMSRSLQVEGLFTSAPVLAWTNCSPTLAQPDRRLLIQTSPGAKVNLQRSDFTWNWVVWTTITNVSGRGLVIPPAEDGRAGEYYRADWIEITNP